MHDAGDPRTMSQVFVFSEQTPFGGDAAGLLQPGAELDALGWETDLDQAIRRIHDNHLPAVIVVAQEAATDCGPSVAQIQRECPGIQIIAVNLETRVVCIHNGGDHLVQDLAELLSAVHRRCAACRERGGARAAGRGEGEAGERRAAQG